MTDLHYAESLEIARPPDALYDLVTDVTRTGEWSPVCKACWWDDGASPTVGAWFTGRNETAERTWETRSQVVAAEPAVEFAWLVGQGWVRWGYRFEPTAAGAIVTESWNLLPAGEEMFRSHYGNEAASRIERRAQEARTGIGSTLRALRLIAER